MLATQSSSQKGARHQSLEEGWSGAGGARLLPPLSFPLPAPAQLVAAPAQLVIAMRTGCWKATAAR